MREYQDLCEKHGKDSDEVKDLLNEVDRLPEPEKKNLCNGEIMCNRENRRKPKNREICKRCRR